MQVFVHLSLNILIFLQFKKKCNLQIASSASESMLIHV